MLADPERSIRVNSPGQLDPEFILFPDLSGVGLPGELDSVSRSLAQDSARTRVILLGTKGGPRVGESGRSNPSTLLFIGGMPYVVDCGYGTSRQLISAGVALTKLRYVFITHLHGDHALELGPLVYNGWAAGLGTPVDVYGPPGTSRMARDFLHYVKYDVDIRIADEGRPDLRKLLLGHDVEAAGVVILESSLQRVDELMHIGRRMRSIALQSAVGGMVLSAVGMVLAALGFLPPVAGAIAQEVIDVFAVVNALRVAVPPKVLTDF